MKRFYALTGVLFALILMTACHSGEKRLMPSDTHYFSGEFVYMADAAVFYDCATGAHYPVSQQDAYLEAERKYMDLKPEPGQRVFVELKGALDSLPGMEEGTRVRALVIESLIGFDPSVSCQKSFMAAGLYEALDKDSVKTVLHLRPDYTLAVTRYLPDSTQVTSDGTWGMASATEVELNIPDKEGLLTHTRLQIDPQQETLMHGKGKHEIQYKKVYI